MRIRLKEDLGDAAEECGLLKGTEYELLPHPAMLETPPLYVFYANNGDMVKVTPDKIELTDSAYVGIGCAKARQVMVSYLEWSGQNVAEMIAFAGLSPTAQTIGEADYKRHVAEKGLRMRTPQGPVNVHINDIVVCVAQVGFYPYSPSTFDKLYLTMGPRDAGIATVREQRHWTPVN